MNKPVLVVLAAGLGSRYGGGGRKQIEPVGDNGELIIDFSVYDAIKAGFEKIVFVIKKEMTKDFDDLLVNKIRNFVDVTYAYQSIDILPKGYSVPEGREKPWGTAHAVLCCKNAVDSNFAVINADDFYGAGSYKILYEYLSNAKDDHLNRYAMVGYRLENTVTDNGSVARGVCQVHKNELQGVVERTRIEKRNGRIEYLDEEWHELSPDSTVSMNFWGFTPSLFTELEYRFSAFLDNMKDPIKSEFFLPFVVDELIKEARANVKVLNCNEKWYGVTYKEDRESVTEAIVRLKQSGAYPKNLWRDIID